MEAYAVVRTQVQLTPAQAEVIKQLARERGVSMAEIVRQSIEAYVRAAQGPTQQEIRRRAKEMAGVLRGGPEDLAARHDDYLVEAFDQ